MLYKKRIDWQLAIPFLIIVWLLVSIDQFWGVAIGWTALIIGVDLILALVNKFKWKSFSDKTTEDNYNE